MENNPVPTPIVIDGESVVLHAPYAFSGETGLVHDSQGDYLITLIWEGMLTNAETGEIVGTVIPPEASVQDDDGLVRWLLRKFRRADAEKAAALFALGIAEAVMDEKRAKALAALQSDPEYVEAQMDAAQCSEIVTRSAKRRASLLAGWSNVLCRWAEANFEGKSRTARVPEGSVSLTRVAPNFEVADEDAALEIARRSGAVKETVLKGALDKASVLAMLDAEDELYGRAFRLVPGTTRVTVPGAGS